MPNCIFCDQDNPPGQSNCRLCAAPLPASDEVTLSEDVFRQELTKLLGSGQKIPAIAAFRRRTGVGLAEAKAAIEALERDHEFEFAADNPDLEWEIMRGLERGEKIGAIRLFREKTGAGLKEAKEAVEAIEVRMGLGPLPGQRGGCLGMLLMLITFLTAAVAWA